MLGHVHCYDSRAKQLARAYGLASNAIRNAVQKPEMVSAQLTADIGTAFSDLPAHNRSFLMSKLNGAGPPKKLKELAVTTGRFTIGDEISRNRERLGAHISAMLEALPELDAALINERSRAGGFTP